MASAYDVTLRGTYHSVDNGRVYFVVSPDDLERPVQFASQTVFYLSEVYWHRIGCPVMYTRHRNVGEQ